MSFLDAAGGDVTGQVLGMLKERFGGGLRAVGQLLYSEADAVKTMARKYGVPFLGSIAQDLELSKATETGRLIEQEGADNVASQVKNIVAALMQACEARTPAGRKDQP